jgi:NADH-quinone oxidoreductase subunit L
MVGTPVLALIPLLPFLGFLVNAFVGRRLPKAVSGGLACLAMFAAFVVGGDGELAARRPARGPADHRADRWSWMVSGDFDLPFAFRLDPLGAVMVLVVTGIGS